MAEVFPEPVVALGVIIRRRRRARVAGNVLALVVAFWWRDPFANSASTHINLPHRTGIVVVVGFCRSIVVVVVRKTSSFPARLVTQTEVVVDQIRSVIRIWGGGRRVKLFVQDAFTLMFRRKLVLGSAYVRTWIFVNPWIVQLFAELFCMGTEDLCANWVVLCIIVIICSILTWSSRRMSTVFKFSRPWILRRN